MSRDNKEPKIPPEIGDVTLRPEQLAAARDKALRINEELRRKEKLSQEEADLVEVLPAEPKEAQGTAQAAGGGNASDQAIEQQRAAALAAFAEGGESAPAREVAPQPVESVEPIHEQLEEVEPVRDQMLESTEKLERPTEQIESVREMQPLPETLTEFSKEQLGFALRESLDLQEALIAGKHDKVKKLLSEFKILFPDQVAIEHRDLLEARLGIKDVQSEFAIKMYQEESPSKVLEYLGPKRVELLSEDLPYLAMRYEPTVEEKLTVRVRQLIPDIQQVIFAGRAHARDFETEFIARPNNEERVERLRQAEQAHELLSPVEWRAVQKGLLTLQTTDLPRQREMINDLPQLGAKLRSHAQEFGMMEIMQEQVQASLEPWLEKLPADEQAAVKKYVQTALELYAGTLGGSQSQK